MRSHGDVRASTGSYQLPLSGAGVPSQPISALPDRNIEMEHLLARAQRLVEPDCRIVSVIGLNEDGPGLAYVRDVLQVTDQGRRDSPPALTFGDGQVVDVDLAPRAFELVQLVGHQSAHDLVVQAGDEHDDVLLGEKGLQIGPAWRLRAIGRGLCKGATEQRVEFLKERGARRGETKDLD